MRTLSAQSLVALALANRSEHLRVSIKDAGGTFRDLSSYAGFNAVNSVVIAESIDGQHRTLDLSLQREMFDFSVAGLVADAPANTGFVPPTAGGTYSPLVQLNRMLKVEVAVCPQDTTTPAAADWVEVFRGYVDHIDDASDDEVKVECRDEGALVQDAFIEKERVYGLGTPRGCRIFEPNTGVTAGVFAVNDYVIPTSTKLNGHYYKVTAITTGITAATEPVWPTGSGSTVVSAGVTFTEQGATSTAGIASHTLMQQILDDNMSSAPTLYTPSAPTWVILPYAQERKPVLESLRDIALTIGFDVRYKWRSGTSQFELTYAEPDRAKTTPDATFTAAQYETVDSLSREIFDIRNAVRVVYSDSAALDPAGYAKRKVVEVTDSTSISTYGRRFMEIAEESSSQIDTSTEATQLANAALSDLKDPAVTQELTTYLFPAVELGDLYRFSANNIHYTADQDLAVVGFRLSMVADGNGGYEAKTSLTCRGKPAVAFRRWFKVEAGKRRPDGEVIEVHRFSDYSNLAALTLALSGQTVGGARLTTVGSPSRSGVSVEREIHISTSSGFTPSSGTLKSIATADTVEVSDLVPGETYYTKAVPRGRNAGRIVRGEPTAEVSFVAGRAKAQHIDYAINPAQMPPNGAFEHATRDIALEPMDRWELATDTIPAPTWGSSGSNYYGTDSVWGRTLVLRGVASNLCRMRSDVFPMIPGSMIDFDITHKGSGTGAGSTNLNVVLEWWKDTAGTASATGATSNTFSTGTGGVFNFDNARQISVPLDANYASMYIEKAAADTNLTVDVGLVYITRSRITQPAHVAPTLLNSWVNFDTSTWTSAGYMIDSLGIIHLRGLVKDGTPSSTSVIFNLPAAYRPSRNHIFAVMSADAFGQCRVLSNGDVVAHAGGSASFCLDGITFRGPS